MAIWNGEKPWVIVVVVTVAVAVAIVVNVVVVVENSAKSSADIGAENSWNLPHFTAADAAVAAGAAEAAGAAHALMFELVRGLKSFFFQRHRRENNPAMRRCRQEANKIKLVRIPLRQQLLKLIRYASRVRRRWNQQSVPENLRGWGASPVPSSVSSASDLCMDGDSMKTHKLVIRH